MNKSAIFRTAHQTAKATRNNFATYRAAFSAALKAAYAPKVEFKHFKNERILPALEAIANGGRWNGIIYGKRLRSGGRETKLTVYVDGKEYYLGTPYTQYAEEAKAEFMGAVRSTPAKARANNQHQNGTIFGASSEGENDSYRLSKTDHLEFAI